MKKTKMVFGKPEIRFVKFDLSDVITTSGGMTAGGENTESGYTGGIGFGGLGGNMSKGTNNTESGYSTGFGFGDPLQ